MQKLVFLPVLLVAACVVAAAYGAIHNQISYTVSPAFFHFDLFDRCMIPDGLRTRAGASLVGVLTSWWMGLVIGIPVFLLALIIPGWKAYVKHSLIAVLLVVTTALAVGLGALAVARWAIRCGPTAQAEIMHDFGYLGGGVGLLVAIAYLIVVRVRIGRTRQSS